MKILMLCHTDLSKKGAQTIHIIEVMKNLKKEGHNVVLFAPDIGRYNEYISKIKYIPTLNVPVLRFIIFNLFLCIYTFIYSIKFKPDVAYGRNRAFGLPLIIMCKILRLLCIVEINGILFDEIKIQGTQNTLHLYISHFSWLLCCKLSNKIVAVTEEIKKELHEKYKIPSDKIIVISNGANTDLFKPMDNSKLKKLKEHLEIKNEYIVGFVGGFSSWHGLDHLIESAPFVLRGLQNVRFLLVGEGRLREEIMNKVKEMNIEDKFIFVGAVEYEKVPDYINLFDVAICFLDRRIPGCPLKFKEYMSCEKPVLVTDTRDFNILSKYNAGIQVRPEDPVEVSNALIKLLKNDDLREQMGKNGRTLVVEKYSWNATAKQVAEVCKQLIK